MQYVSNIKRNIYFQFSNYNCYIFYTMQVSLNLFFLFLFYFHLNFYILIIHYFLFLYYFITFVLFVYLIFFFVFFWLVSSTFISSICFCLQTLLSLNVDLVVRARRHTCPAFAYMLFILAPAFMAKSKRIW